MNPVGNLVANGYMGMQLLEFVMKQFPHTRKKIELALQQGYSPEQVGSYLEKEFAGKADTKAKRRLEKNISGTPTEMEASRAKELRGKREDRLMKTVGSIGLAAAGGMAARAALGGRGATSLLPAISAQNPAGAMPLPGAGPMPGMGPMPGAGSMVPPSGGMGGSSPGFLGNVLSRYTQHIARGGRMNLDNFIKAATQEAARGFTQQGQQPTGGMPQQEPIDVTQETQWGTPGQPQSTAPMQQPAQPMEAAGASTENLPTPTEPLTDQSKAALQDTDKILDAMKLKPTIESLLKAGNQPEVIADLINFKLTPGQKAWVKEEGIDIPLAVKQYADKVGIQPVEQALPQPEPSKAALQQEETKPLEEVEEAKPYRPEPLAKGSVALLPNGDLGTVTGIQGNRVDLDVDGQRKVAPTDHVVQTSYDPKNLMQSVEAYWDEMPEEEKSAPMWFNFYSPASKTAMVGFLNDPEHIGVYHGVPQEVWDEFIAGSTPAKTTGKTGLGAEWQAGSPSKFGAALGKTLKAKNPDKTDKYPYEKVKTTHNNMLKFLQASKELKGQREKEEKEKDRETAKKALKSLSEPPESSKHEVEKAQKKRAKPKASERKEAKPIELEAVPTRTEEDKEQMGRYRAGREYMKNRPVAEVKEKESPKQTPAEKELPDQYMEWEKQKTSPTYSSFTNEDLDYARGNFSKRHDYYLREGISDKRSEMKEKLNEIDVEKERRKEWYDLQRRALQAEESRKTGKLYLSKEDKKKILRNARDVYVDNQAIKETKGFTRYGDEIIGYAYAPEFFIKSDLSGMPVRHYVILPDERIAHPDELEEAAYRDRIIIEGNVDRFKIPKAPWEK